MALISVIVPVYNKEHQIRRCIDSVLNQSFEDWELILINDGSTDNSSLIIDSFNSDTRIRSYYKENGGVSSARNLGIRKAQGEWIIFLDADDYFLPDALNILLNTALKNKTRVSVANFYVEKDNKRYGQCEGRNRIVKNNFRSWYFMTCYLRAGNTLLHLSTVKDVLFDETLHRYEDVKFWFEIMREYKIAYVSEYVMIYSENCRSLSFPVNNVIRDYIFSMDFQRKIFWEKIVLAGLLKHGFYCYPKYVSLLKNKYKKYLYLIYIERMISLFPFLYIRMIRFIRKIKNHVGIYR